LDLSDGIRSKELHTVFQAVITVVGYVKNSPLRGRLYKVMWWYGVGAPILLGNTVAHSRFPELLDWKKK